jgi:hypothetical protein
MGRWIKYYADNSQYVGLDSDISKGKATWRGSKNTDIVRVDLLHQDMLLRIVGPGEYWQSDVYEAKFLNSESQLIKRRIEKRIDPTDKMFIYLNTSNENIVTFNNISVRGHSNLIPPGWVGKWLILEYDVIRRNARYYVRDGKV